MDRVSEEKTSLGHIFFDGNVNGRANLEMLNNLVLPQVKNILCVKQNGSIPRAFWFQDGALGHLLNAVHDNLQTLFPNRVVGARYLVSYFLN